MFCYWLTTFVVFAHVEYNVVVGFKILDTYENYDDVPAPLRFQRVNTTNEINVSTADIPYRGILEYFRVLTDSDYALLLAGKRNFCPSNTGVSKQIDMSEPGVVKTLRFTAREMTKLKVFENGKEEKLKILFHSTYDENYQMSPPDNSTKWDDILRALNESSIFNITYRALVNPDKTSTCPTTEYYPVPNDWCHHTDVLYKTRVIKPAVSQQKYCSITFADQIKHYKALWEIKTTPLTSFSRCVQPENMNLDFATEFVGTELETMYPNYFLCHKAHGGNIKVPPCFDDRVNKISFKENGRGTVIDMVVGRSDNNNSIDFNFTIEFGKWTSDFSLFFTETFRDCGYEMPETYLEMTVFIKEIIIIPERGPPAWILPFSIITAIPIFILLTGTFCLLLFCCTKKGFNLHLWRFYQENEERKLKKIKKENLETKEEFRENEKSFDNPVFES